MSAVLLTSLTACDTPEEKQKKQAISALLSRGIQEENYNLELTRAVLCKDLEKAGLLLTAGVKSDMSCKFAGDEGLVPNPISIAICTGQKEMVQLLLGHVTDFKLNLGVWARFIEDSYRFKDECQAAGYNDDMIRHIMGAYRCSKEEGCLSTALRCGNVEIAEMVFAAFPNDKVSVDTLNFAWNLYAQPNDKMRELLEKIEARKSPTTE